MKAKRFLKKVGQLVKPHPRPGHAGTHELSCLPEAPDHGWPELAVVLGRRIVPVAVGSEATVLWHHPLDEEGFRALAVAEASLLAERYAA